MTLDVEFTLNRFGFRRVARNKLQLAFVRLSWWRVPGKHSVGVELNWKVPNAR